MATSTQPNPIQINYIVASQLKWLQNFTLSAKTIDIGRRIQRGASVIEAILV